MSNVNLKNLLILNEFDEIKLCLLKSALLLFMCFCHLLPASHNTPDYGVLRTSLLLFLQQRRCC